MGQDTSNQKQKPSSPTPTPTSFITGDSAMARRLRAGCHYYAFVVIYIVMLSAFGSFMNDMYSPALPAMCRFFGCSVSTVQMGITIGMIGLAVGAVAAPCVGIGNLLHATAITFAAITVLLFLFSIASYRLASDL